ncbi:hypothetical protein GUJ93_ZPchr0013g35192 [Zizania palustris]|uniref:BHLH domain-containing protein n=1 Tax=Zizania palustris TaxID=103762 RepID=A0A8J5WUK7_ZIZPA|nr:hypothetical protein GUJ93_ZPchr0013g35192 [Zizania palustris]
MEPGGVIAEAGWSSLDLSSQAEESEIMEQLLGTCFPSNGEDDHHEFPWLVKESNAYYLHCNASSSGYSSTISNSAGSGSLSLIAPSEYEGYYLCDSNEALGVSSCTASLDLNMFQEQGAAQFMDSILKRNGDSSCEDLADSSVNLLGSIGTCNKRKAEEQGRQDDQIRSRKCAKKAGSKRAKKATRCEGEDGSVAVTNGQTLSCCTSENDSIASQESPVAAKPNGKAQSSHRSAIDYTLACRMQKRREKINERLKILQNLVPNGTKVDISTMLEEAMQFQVSCSFKSSSSARMKCGCMRRSLSNGMNIGIDLNLSQH